MEAKAIEYKTEELVKKYRDYVDFYESKSLLAKTKGSLDTFDYYAFTKKLENTENYLNFVKESGGLDSMGELPKIALGVITAQSTIDITPLFASVQPLDEQSGLIYYKEVKAWNSRGDVNAGDVLVDTQTGRKKLPDVFVSGEVVDEVGATGDGTNTAFAFTMQYPPVLPRKVEVKLQSDPTIRAVDDGNGVLLGNGVSGTVNYTTGAITLNFATAPANGDNILVTYETAYDAAEMDELPTIVSEFKTVPIQTKVLALRTELGILKSFSMSKRFGISSEELMAKELTTELNSAVSTSAIKQVYANALGTITFDVTPPAGVSDADRKISFLTTTVAKAEGTIMDNSGRSVSNTVFIAGTAASAYLMGMPGFEKVGATFNATGSVLIGYLNGRPVIRTTVIPANEIILSAKEDIFTAAVFEGVYLPLFVTEINKAINLNELRQSRAVATSVGFASPIPGLATKIELQNL